MSANIINTNRIIHELNALRSNYSNAGKRKLEICLEQLAGIGSFNAPQLKNCYHLLLFIVAYPGNKNIYDRALGELNRLPRLLKENKRLQQRLQNSGIPGSAVTGCFSHYLTKLFFQQDPGLISLFSVDGDKDLVMQTINGSLAATEREMLGEEKMNWNNWIRLFGGRTKKEQFRFLLRQTEQLTRNTDLRESLFAGFKLFTRLQLGERPLYFSSPGSIFVHTNRLMRAGVDGTMDIKPVFKQLPLTKEEKLELVGIAQKSIYPFFKETDPFTYASVHETEYFTGPRGTGFALFYLLPQKKLSLECYCGYLAFKNNIPVAYGGGWLLGKQCRFGLNILPPFRGGESMLIAQYLVGLYAAHFRVDSFIVEPFQLGKGNKEGIQSSAFWFYYRLGFRPMQSALAEFAAAEYQKIRSDKRYRCPLPVLKKLSSAVMRSGSMDTPCLDINIISRALTGHLKNKFGNDREIAARSLKVKAGHEPDLYLLNDLLEPEYRSNSREMAAIQRMFILKKKNERQYLLEVQQKPALTRLLFQVQRNAM